MVEFLNNQMQDLNLDGYSSPDKEIKDKPENNIETQPMLSDDTISGGEGTNVLLGGEGTTDNLSQYPNAADQGVMERVSNQVNKYNSEKRSWLERSSREVEQFGKIGFAALGEGLKTASYDFINKLPQFKDIIGNVLEMGLEYPSEYAKKYYKYWFEDQAYTPHIPSLADRSSATGDLAEILFKTTYFDQLGKQRYNEWKKSLEIPDEEEGFMDAIALYGGRFLGEMLLLPVGATKAGITKTLSGVSKELIKKTAKDVELRKTLVHTIKDENLKRATMAVLAGKEPITKESLQLSHTMFDTLKEIFLGAKNHVATASNYALGGAMAATIAENTLTSWFDFSKKEAQGHAIHYGLIGMLVGAKPLTSAAYKLTSLVIPQKINPIEVTRKVRHGVMALYHGIKMQQLQKKASGAVETYGENSVQHQYYLLRLNGATRKEAQMLSSESPEVAQNWIYNNVKEENIKDALTFLSMLQKMMSKDPEFGKWVMDAKNRQETLHQKFSDVFLKEGTIQNDKLKRAFVENLNMSKNLSKTEVEQLAKEIEIGDFPVFLDQMFMLDFLTGLRNATLSRVSLGTLSRKDETDLITAASQYNAGIDKQVDILKAALKSFAPLSKSESTKTFFDALQSRVNVAIDSTAAANERVKNLLNANIANKAKARTSDIIEEMNVAFNINKYRGLTEGDPDIISKSVQKSIDSFENQRETVFQKFDDAYADIELGISSMLNNLGDTLRDSALNNVFNIFRVRTIDGKMLDGLSSFKYVTRKRGLEKQFEAQKWADNNVNYEDLSGIADQLDSVIVAAHKKIHLEDNSILSQNNFPNYSLDPQSTIQKTQKEIFERLQLPEGEAGKINIAQAKDILLKTMRKELDNFSRINTISDDSIGVIGRKEIDDIVDVVAKPTASVGELNKIIQEVNKQIRKSNDDDHINKLIQYKNEISNQYRAISENTKVLVGDKEKTVYERFRQLQTDYKNEYADVYYNGLGNAFRNFQKDQKLPIEEIFNLFVKNPNSRVAAQSFNKLFPKGSAGREEAIEQLKYAIGQVLLKGDSVKKGAESPNGFKSIAKGRPEMFIDQFADIIGDKAAKTFRKWREWENTKFTQVQDVEKADLKIVSNAMKTIAENNAEFLKGTMFAKLAGTDLSYEQLSKLISTEHIGTKFAISSDIGRPIKQAKKQISQKIDERVPVDDFSSATTKGMVRRDLEESSLEIVSKKEINQDFIEMILTDPVIRNSKDFDKIKESLKSIVIHRLIDESFTVTSKKTLNLGGKFDLAEDFSIATFGNMFKSNKESLVKLFDEDEFQILSEFFFFP